MCISGDYKNSSNLEPCGGGGWFIFNFTFKTCCVE